jgi:hypothetical protein
MMVTRKLLYRRKCGRFNKKASIGRIQLARVNSSTRSQEWNFPLTRANVFQEGFMLKKLAIGFGVIFVIIGILGFIPGFMRDGHLFGIFHVNAAHNAVHLLTGGVAIACGMASAYASQMFFRIFGVVYGLVAILGFVGGDKPVLGFISNNIADAWLHTAIAAVSLFLGFVYHEVTTPLDKPRVA